MICRMVTNNKGGKCNTAILNTRYVVPQIKQIAPNAMYGISKSFFTASILAATLKPHQSL